MGGFLALFARGLEWTSAFFGAYGFLQIMFTVLEDESNLSDRYGGDSVTFFSCLQFWLSALLATLSFLLWLPGRGRKGM